MRLIQENHKPGPRTLKGHSHILSPTFPSRMFVMKRREAVSNGKKQNKTKEKKEKINLRNRRLLAHLAIGVKQIITFKMKWKFQQLISAYKQRSEFAL